MSSPKLSIVTPSYNQAEFIEKNLRSVCSQSSEKVEHIVVDGGSDDETTDILRQYEDEYNLEWVSEPDRGQTHALNKGLDLAEGDWIGWQNSDDYYLPGAFKHLSMAIEQDPSADAVYGDLCIVDENGNQLSRLFMTPPSKFVQRYWSLFASNQSLFVKRSAFDDIGPLNEDLVYTMDAELTWEILDRDYDLKHMSKPLGAFRVQSNAKTYRDVSPKQREELDSIYDSPWYEYFIPKSTLESTAKLVKFGLLLQERRFKALKYNVKKRIR